MSCIRKTDVRDPPLTPLPAYLPWFTGLLWSEVPSALILRLGDRLSVIFVSNSGSSQYANSPGLCLDRAPP